jgi:signal recognition particle subunit SRP54
MAGVVDSMTPAERRDPKLIDPGRRRRIASGAGVPVQQVSELVKQFDMMKPYMTGMAGMSGNDRMQMMDHLKERMLDPSMQGPKVKKGTGKRLTAKEREKLKKQREKILRDKRRRDRGQ